MCPEVTLFGLEIEAYPLMYTLGAMAAYAVCSILTRRAGLSLLKMTVLFISALSSGLIGAAIAYGSVTWGFAGTLERLMSGNFSFGLVFYGGLIGGIGFTALISRLLRLSFRSYAECMLPSLPLAHAIGRIGCFMSGCCYGITISEAGARLPVQLIESACLIAIFIALLRCFANGSKHILSAYIIMYAPVRLLLEFLRGDAVRGHFLIFSTSQWISLMLLVLCAAAHLIRRGKNKQ